MRQVVSRAISVPKDCCMRQARARLLSGFANRAIAVWNSPS